jgi:hypothetical protein
LSLEREPFRPASRLNVGSTILNEIRMYDRRTTMARSSVRSVMLLLGVGALVLVGCVSPTEEPAPPTDTPAEAPDQVRDALQAALSYLAANHPGEGPDSGLSWAEELATPEEWVGATTFRYLAGDWVITVSYPIVLPENVIYTVVVQNESGGFSWEGTVDPAGQVTEATGESGMDVVGWYGYVVGLTAEGGQFDDYVVLMPEGTGEFGIEGADETSQAAIVALRDAEEPGKHAHLWGTLTCGVPDYGGCQLLVSRLRVDGPGPFFDPDPVEGWVGRIESVEGWEPGLYEQYFVLDGEPSIRYGIDGTLAGLNDEIEALRDSGTAVRIWGILRCGVPDYNASQIAVERIETVE